MFLDIDKHASDQIALVDDDGIKLSFKEISDFSEYVVSYIPARSVVFILSENSSAPVCFYLACLEKGIVPVLLGADIDNSLMEKLFTIYKPQFVFQPIYLSTSLKSSVFDYHNYRLLETGYEPYPVNDLLALLLPTSGSTGSPKLVRHSRANLEYNAKNVAKVFNIEKSDKPLLILPFHYTMGMSIVCSHIFAGATTILTKKTLTDRPLWTILKEQKITSLTGVPFSFEILEKLRFFRMDLPDLKLISQGGGKLRADLFHATAVYAEKTGKQFIATYGQTEATARMSYLPPDKAINKTCSIGIPLPEGEFSILDDYNVETKQGKAKGELIYRGPNVTLGYANGLSDLMLGDINQGMLYTGDIAERDEEGFYYIVGRKSRFLKLYGVRIGLDDVEHLIKSSFPVDCYCSGNDEKMLVTITDSSKIKDVKKLITEKLGIFNQAFEVVHIDKIHRNQSGKILYSN